MSGTRTAARRRIAQAMAVTILTTSCSTQQIIDLALSGDPKAALQNLGQQRVQTYKHNPQAAINDLTTLKGELSNLFGSLERESGKRWGSEAREVPRPKRYVKYTEHYENRAIVDYEEGYIRVESVEEGDTTESLQSAIVKTLLTPDDPKSVDVFSDADVPESTSPFLQTLVVDERGRELTTRRDVERYAQYLARHQQQQRRVNVNGKPATVSSVQFEMVNARSKTPTRPPQVATKPPPATPAPRAKPADPGKPSTPPARHDQPDHLADGRPDPNSYAAADKLAPRYLNTVNKFAKATGVDPALIFGIIYQESRFNPHAISHAGAYGMMQLVPRTGGIEAYRKAKGQRAAPTKEYLMDPHNNIELGATYVGILLHDYWMKEVNNRSSREYCAISGYNTGIGNVALALGGNTKNSGMARAKVKANGMAPAQVFDFLRTNLPYAETREYLIRVSAARRHYHKMFYAGRKA